MPNDRQRQVLPVLKQTRMQKTRPCLAQNASPYKSESCSSYVQEQHKGSKGHPRQRELVSLCQLPFVLTPEAKAKIMQGEALLQKQHQMQALTIQVSFQQQYFPAVYLCALS